MQMLRPSKKRSSSKPPVAPWVEQRPADAYLITLESLYALQQIF
jgi:hypothetical protein